MAKLMRCPFCGLLQDEPPGVKECKRCGGQLEFDGGQLPGSTSYVQVQMELDQVAAPAGRNGERHLLLTIRTPEKVPAEDAVPGGKERPSINFTAVLDASGSMQGEKIEQVKDALTRAVRFLREGDVFSLETFGNHSTTLFEAVEVNKVTRDEFLARISRLGAGGMTALWQGLNAGIEDSREEPRTNNLLLLLSDGQANVGETDLEVIGQAAAKARAENLIVSTLGVGDDYNEALMTEVATQGGGRFYHIEEARQIPVFVAGELGEVASLAAREVKIKLTLPQGATLLPFTAAYPVQQAGSEAEILVGDIPCATELEVPLRLAFLAHKKDSRLSVEGALDFKSPVDKAHSVPINRVTVRFTDPQAFQLREGIVMPVAEKVFAQMKAASVIGVSRVRAMRPSEAVQSTNMAINSLREYANLLGGDLAEKEMSEAAEELHALGISSSAAKHSVSRAAAHIRSIKDFLG